MSLIVPCGQLMLAGGSRAQPPVQPRRKASKGYVVAVSGAAYRRPPAVKAAEGFDAQDSAVSMTVCPHRKVMEVI
jgi:hypothetical protein